jgi:hypothetical protein
MLLLFRLGAVAGGSACQVVKLPIQHSFMSRNKLIVTDILIISTVSRISFWLGALLAHHTYQDDWHLSRVPRRFFRLNTCVSTTISLAASTRSTTHCLDHDYITLSVTPVRCLAGARHASLTDVFITFEQPPSSDVPFL